MACEEIQAKLQALRVEEGELRAELIDLGPHPNPIIKAKFDQQLAQTKAAISAAEKELNDCLGSSAQPSCGYIQTKIDSLKQAAALLQAELNSGVGGTWQIAEQLARTKLIISAAEKELADCQSGKAPQLPMNLVWSELDDNGIPKNPGWNYQLLNPGEIPDPLLVCPIGFDDPRCTNQSPTEDSASGFNGALCSAGHLNWMAGTYEGPIFWDSHSTPGTDDDYNLRLVTPEGAGQTTANGGTLLLEFDSDETIDHFDTPWWNSFHAAVDFSDSQAKSMVDGRFAIVTGLVGLDIEHSSHAELHPVWAMAIRVNDDPADETWSIFVRNWGNEGFCSSHQHYLDLPNNTYTFRLPWRSGADSVNTTVANFLGNIHEITGPGVSALPDQGVLVAFTLPPPEQGPLLNGEIHFAWSGAQVAALSPAPAIAIPEKPTDPNSPHAKLETLINNLTPEQRHIFSASFQKSPSLDTIVPETFNASVTPGASAAQVRSVLDPKQEQKGERLAQALHAVFGPNIPGLALEL